MKNSIAASLARSSASVPPRCTVAALPTSAFSHGIGADSAKSILYTPAP